MCWAPCEWARYMKTKLLPLVAPGPVRSDHTLRALSSRLRMVKRTEPTLWEAGVDLCRVLGQASWRKQHSLTSCESCKHLFVHGNYIRNLHFLLSPILLLKLHFSPVCGYVCLCVYIWRWQWEGREVMRNRCHLEIPHPKPCLLSLSHPCQRSPKFSRRRRSW